MRFLSKRKFSRKSETAVATAGLDFQRNPTPTRLFGKISRKNGLLAINKKSQTVKTFAKIVPLAVIMLFASVFLFAKNYLVHATTLPDPWVMNADNVQIYQGQRWIPENLPGLYNIQWYYCPSGMTCNGSQNTGWRQYVTESDNVNTQVPGTYNATYSFGATHVTITVTVLPRPACSPTPSTTLNLISTPSAQVTAATVVSRLNSLQANIAGTCAVANQLYPGETTGFSTDVVSSNDFGVYTTPAAGTLTAGSGTIDGVNYGIPQNTYLVTYFAPYSYAARTVSYNAGWSTYRSLWWIPGYNPEQTVTITTDAIIRPPTTKTALAAVPITLNINVVYTVDFITNGGTSVPSQTIQAGEIFAKPVDPMRPGYTFAGWFTDNGTFAHKYDFASAVSEDLQLFAKWTPIAPQIFVKDSTLTVGDTWNAADNFANGIDSTGVSIDFNSTDFTADGSVDTSVPGTYIVKYIFTDPTTGLTAISTATITVAAKLVDPPIIANPETPSESTNPSVPPTTIASPNTGIREEEL